MKPFILQRTKFINQNWILHIASAKASTKHLCKVYLSDGNAILLCYCYNTRNISGKDQKIRIKNSNSRSAILTLF